MENQRFFNRFFCRKMSDFGEVKRVIYKGAEKNGNFHPFSSTKLENCDKI